MSDPKVAVIIPFRLRESADLRRGANLEVVQGWWYAQGFDPQIVSDGLSGDAQFNRHRAYNIGVSRNPEADAFVFAEADMLIHPDQINTAVEQAVARPGLVVPFTQYRYLSDISTGVLRETYSDMPPSALAPWWAEPVKSDTSIFQWNPESIEDNGKSIGAINVVSRRTLDITGGFTEATSGNWYDDNIIEEGFAFLTRKRTRWVKGPAVHLYHLPGHRGDHLSEEDIRATQRNKTLLNVMRQNIRAQRPVEVKRLLSHRVREINP